VEFQVPDHDGVSGIGVAAAVKIVGDSTGAVGVGVVFGVELVQPAATSITHAKPARIRTRDFFIMIKETFFLKVFIPVEMMVPGIFSYTLTFSPVREAL
jgi:hypothetical protein